MRPRISIKQGKEMLASHSGLILIGNLLQATGLKKQLKTIEGVYCKSPSFSHADIIFSMAGLISTAKPDYDSIEIFRHKQDFFRSALGISGCPSSATLRQRVDLIGTKANTTIKLAAANMIKEKAPGLTEVNTLCGTYVPLDIDVSPFDNSQTKKQGVSRTYKGYDGYALIFAYLGEEGYLVNVEFREGKQHCQKHTPEFINQTLQYTRQITTKPILMRLDSGNDSVDNFPVIEKFTDVHFIIKRNLRRESRQAWLDLAKKQGVERYRSAKRTVWIGKTKHDIKGNLLPYPITFEVSEIWQKKGQQLLFPEIEIDTYWCSLQEMEPEQVIDLYHDHGTSEQFHSELKSDMGLERLPSGYFESNSLILHLGLLSYNMLRIIGQMSLEHDNSNLPGSRRKKVSRRRIRTVIQDLMYMAGRLIKTGRKKYISFGQLNPFAPIAGLIEAKLRVPIPT